MRTRRCGRSQLARRPRLAIDASTASIAWSRFVRLLLVRRRSSARACRVRCGRGTPPAALGRIRRPQQVRRRLDLAHRRLERREFRRRSRWRGTADGRAPRGDRPHPRRRSPAAHRWRGPGCSAARLAGELRLLLLECEHPVTLAAMLGVVRGSRATSWPKSRTLSSMAKSKSGGVDDVGRVRSMSILPVRRRAAPKPGVRPSRATSRADAPMSGRCGSRLGGRNRADRGVGLAARRSRSAPIRRGAAARRTTVHDALVRARGSLVVRASQRLRDRSPYCSCARRAREPVARAPRPRSRPARGTARRERAGASRGSSASRAWHGCRHPASVPARTSPVPSSAEASGARNAIAESSAERATPQAGLTAGGEPGLRNACAKGRGSGLAGSPIRRATSVGSGAPRAPRRS